MDEIKINNLYFKEKNGRRILFTRNFCPGKQVHKEFLLREDNIEYREFEPYKSKLAAAILKGIDLEILNKISTILYLGASTGTTVSYLSDILAERGSIFALDHAPRVVRRLLFVAKERNNIIPILADASKPESYYHRILSADFIYQDIAQKNQTEIFLKNCELFLKNNGYACLAVKARSIDVTKAPKKIYEEEKEKIKKHLKIMQFVALDPYQRDHGFFVVRNL